MLSRANFSFNLCKRKKWFPGNGPTLYSRFSQTNSSCNYLILRMSSQTDASDAALPHMSSKQVFYFISLEFIYLCRNGPGMPLCEEINLALCCKMNSTPMYVQCKYVKNSHLLRHCLLFTATLGKISHLKPCLSHEPTMLVCRRHVTKSHILHFGPHPDW